MVSQSDINPLATVMVVDDDPAIRMLVSRRLEHAGYTAVAADSGENALELLQKRNVDLMVLDVMMPGLDGYQVLEHVRARHSQTALPVIMLTARDKGEDVIRALRLGANDYALKPVDFQSLLKRMEVHLSLRGDRGSTLGNYLIQHRVGAGGMGVVYAAVDRRDNRALALKVLPRSLTLDDSYVRRFLREAALAERLDHPNVVRVLDAGRFDETYFIAMELVDGQNLAEIVDKGPLSVKQALGIARQVAAGLLALKEAGILHRDIKPENVLVSKSGVAKITDFGIAREAMSVGRMTEIGVGVGSVLYASPEQMSGVGDYRSDLYSMGCTLFYMLTGSDPFPSNKPVEWIVDHKLNRPPKITDVNAALPVPVAEFVARLMAAKPEKRVQSYEEVDRLLKQLLVHPAVTRGFSPRRWLRWTLAVGAALLAAGLVFQLARYG